MRKDKAPKPENMGRDRLESKAETVIEGKVLNNQIVICKHPGCHDIMTTRGFCRFHYLVSWKKLKTKEAKKNGVELDAYLSELGKKFPEEFLEKLRADIEEMSAEKEQSSEAEESFEKGSLFDQMDGDEDIETIIHGIKVEDF